MNNNAYVYNPLFKKILDSEIDSLAMKNKVNIEQVHKQNVINNKIRNKMMSMKNSSLKKIYISNTEIPKSWLNRVDYSKYVKSVFKDRELQEYMRKSYPTEDVANMNINLKNKEYIKLYTETKQKKILNFKFKKNIKIKKSKLKNNEESNFLKIIKYKDADEIFDNNREMFSEREVKDENEEFIRYANMINSIDLFETEDDENNGSEFLNRERQKRNKKRKDSDIDNALKLINLGKENKKIMIQEKNTVKKNDDVLFGIENPKLSPQNKRKTINKTSPIHRSSIFRKSLIDKKHIIELNKVEDKISSYDTNIFKLSDDKDEKINEIISSKEIILSSGDFDKKKIIENSRFKRDKKFNDLINKMKSSKDNDHKFKLKNEENSLYYGDSILNKASNLNKIKKFLKLPKLENSQVKNLIFEIKDYSSYGPYISNCETCSKKNINFYNSSDTDTAIKILKSIKNMNIKRKDLLYEDNKKENI